MAIESSEYPGRIKKLQRALERRRLDAMLVFDRGNTLYLTGFRPSLSLLLVTPRSATFLIDGRYIEAARARVSHCEVRLMTTPSIGLGKWAAEFKPRSVGFEGSTPWSNIHHWQEIMPGEWQPADELVSSMRLIKSPAEARAIRYSAQVNDEVLARVLDSIEGGETEAEIARRIRHEADALGAERLSFDSIVASGPMSSRPHYQPQERQLARGDLLLIDMGMIVDNYCSDMTRVVAIGKRPRPRLMKAYEALLRAQEKTLKEVAPGVACSDLDRIARTSLKRYRLDRYFTHGLGHGVGLDIHEAPTLNPRSKEVLRAGMVITIEPGVYLPGQGGIRIEDLVLVTRHGYEVLSRTPKEFRIFA